MYVFFDSSGIIQDIAVATDPIDGYSSPYAGLDELFLNDTQNVAVAQRPDMYLIVDGVPVLQAISSIPPISLANVQQAKIAELANAYDNSLAAGFTSSASGSTMLYGYTSTDQTKWMKLFIGKANGVIPSSQPVATANGTIVNLTQEQLLQLLVDLETFEQTQENTYHQLLLQNAAATTVDQVNAIIW